LTGNKTVKAREKTFSKDAVIFAEGDEADYVYVVTSGCIELSKQGADGPATLALLGPQDLFGEVGPYDESPRNVTARALEKTRVRMIAKDQFRAWIAEEPDAAMRIIATLVERLRAADEMIAKLGGVGLADEARKTVSSGNDSDQPKRMGFVDALKTLLFRKKDGLADGGDGPVPSFQVGVCTVNNDVDGAWSRALASLLEGKQGVAARVLPVNLHIDHGADQAQAQAAVSRARQVLAREENLDLLVWGDVHEEGFTLWFTPVGPVDEDRLGSFGPFFSLDLSGGLEPPVAEIFHLAVLAAIEPINEGQRVLQRLCLPSALQLLPPFPEGLSVQWSLEQQRTALICYGHALSTLAGWETDPKFYDRAAEAYRAALMRLAPEQAQGLDEALGHKYLAGAAMAASDRRQDTAFLEYAVGEYRVAVECLFKGAYPLEWAAAQNRLGQGLYKLDLRTGQSELLKESLAAFQAALTVYTRTENPTRWADVMNNLAQVLQVYGDQAKNPDVLQRAVEACRAALEIRTRDRFPYGFAASQNTLGTALFLLDKHSKSSDHLDQAKAAYSAALDVYRSLGATRQAQVTEKNLSHIQKQGGKKASPDRKLADPNWAGED